MAEAQEWHTLMACSFATQTGGLTLFLFCGLPFPDIDNLQRVSLPETQHLGCDAHLAANFHRRPIRLYPSQRHVLPAGDGFACCFVCCLTFTYLLTSVLNVTYHHAALYAV